MPLNVKPGMLPSMGSQRVGHNWETELISPWLVHNCSMPLCPHLKTKELIAYTLGPLWRLLLSLYLVAQLCVTLCDSTDCSVPGPSVHGDFQAKLPEWVAISFSRESSQLRDWTLSSSKSPALQADPLPLSHWEIKSSNLREAFSSVWHREIFKILSYQI